MKLYFPQIPRIFSAFILWSLLFALIGINVFARLNHPLTYSDALLSIFRKPADWGAHMQLGQTLWKEGDRTQAKKELTIAQELFAQGAQVLGVSTTPSDILESWQKEPLKERTLLEFWQQVVLDRPDYRDGFLELAYISYGAGKLPQAKAYLAEAQHLDPNNTTITHIAEFLKK